MSKFCVLWHTDVILQQSRTREYYVWNYVDEAEDVLSLIGRLKKESNKMADLVLKVYCTSCEFEI